MHMQQLTNAAAHSAPSIIGTIITFTLGFVGNAALSQTALAMGILSGLATFLYTCWKWHSEYKAIANKKRKP